MNLSHISVNDGVRRRLEASLARLGHAYIISGPSNEANQALADLISQACVCTAREGKPCGVCSGCKKALGGIHPDIIRLVPLEDKNTVAVNQVRDMRADAYIRPNEAERKVYIVDPTLFAKQDSSQNALLKVLEEGPDYVTFLFLVRQPEQLLTTIRSRCEILSLNANEQMPVSDAVRAAAKETARLLLEGGELELMEHMVGLENKKWERETVQSFLSVIEDAVREEMPRRTEQCAKLLDTIKQVKKGCIQNVNTGNLLGWLAAGR